MSFAVEQSYMDTFVMCYTYMLMYIFTTVIKFRELCGYPVVILSGIKYSSIWLL